MVTAYILIEMVAGHSNKLVEALKDRPDVLQTSRITGPFDVIAIIEGEDLTAISNSVAAGIHSRPGVLRTTTCVRLE